jgi:23S rRNA (cytidine1920-2'-O)/16S rRNA (cytidine1409-2'-O)-methyltransferase
MSGRGEFVSRAGHKLAEALRAFTIDPAGLVCIDFGSHTGGFVQCLLRHAAARVYAVDPGYGILDAAVRADNRVVVCERTNALDYQPHEPADLITIDVGWTPQRLILPAARRCLRPGGRVITLIKPHYEAPKKYLRRGLLIAEYVDEVLAACREDITDLKWRIVAETASPVAGHGGNREWLWLLEQA